MTKKKRIKRLTKAQREELQLNKMPETVYDETRYPRLRKPDRDREPHDT